MMFRTPQQYQSLFAQPIHQLQQHQPSFSQLPWWANQSMSNLNPLVQPLLPSNPAGGAFSSDLGPFGVASTVALNPIQFGLPGILSGSTQQQLSPALLQALLSNSQQDPSLSLGSASSFVPQDSSTGLAALGLPGMRSAMGLPLGIQNQSLFLSGSHDQIGFGNVGGGASNIAHQTVVGAAAGTESGPQGLPRVLAQPEDSRKLSSHQVFLRHQIEAFQATEDDITTHTRGRNKPIMIGQVGIRCRHCSHLPVARRQKGSTYFPNSLSGLYQAAQNMSTTHMRCGLCTEMPSAVKQQFALLIASKTSSGAGRPYWAKSAEKLGLVDTEDGIRFIHDLPPGTHVLRTEDSARR